MAGFSAKDVQTLRQATGAGMLDCKRALQENDGDAEAAALWLREQGLAGAAKLSSRDASEGAVAAVRDGDVAALVEVRCETDFVAKSAEFVDLADEVAALVVAKGEDAVSELSGEVDRLRTTLKENISIGRVIRLVAGSGEVLDSYLHQQGGRGKIGVVVLLKDGTHEQAHDIAVHVAFARPIYLTRDEVPAEEIAAERATIETISRNEGKPEAALGKIVEGRMNGWFKERCLVDQPYVKNDKQSVSEFLGAAEVVRFAQVEIGS